MTAELFAEALLLDRQGEFREKKPRKPLHSGNSGSRQV